MPQNQKYACWVGIIDLAARVATKASQGKIRQDIPAFLFAVINEAWALVGP